MIKPKYHTLGNFTEEVLSKDFKTAMHTREVMSGTEELVKMPRDLLASRFDDYELAHERLGKIIKRICSGSDV